MAPGIPLVNGIVLFFELRRNCGKYLQPKDALFYGV